MPHSLAVQLGSFLDEGPGLVVRSPSRRDCSLQLTLGDGYLLTRTKPSRRWSWPPACPASLTRQTRDALWKKRLTFVLVPGGKACSQPLFRANMIEINGAAWLYLPGKTEEGIVNCGTHIFAALTSTFWDCVVHPAASQPAVLSICADCDFYPS